MELPVSHPGIASAGNPSAAPLVIGEPAQAKPAAPSGSEKQNFDAVASVRYPVKVSAVPLPDGAAIATYRTFIIEIMQAMIRQTRRTQLWPGGGWRVQPPGSERSRFFQHQVPVQEGMIVFEDNVARHRVSPAVTGPRPPSGPVVARPSECRPNRPSRGNPGARHGGQSRREWPGAPGGFRRIRRR